MCEFHIPEWNCVSDDAKDFVRKMLDPDPNTRLDPASALKHPWLDQAINAAQWSDMPTRGIEGLPGVHVVMDSDEEVFSSPEVDRFAHQQQRQQHAQKAGRSPSPTKPKDNKSDCTVS